MPREGKLHFDIERVKGKKDQFDKIVQETEDFYNKVESNPVEITVGDVKSAVIGLQTIQQEIDNIRTDPNSNAGILEFAQQLEDVVDRAQGEFAQIGIMFKDVNSNSKQFVSGLEDIMQGLGNDKLGVRFVDVTGQFQELQERAEELYNTLKTIGTDTLNYNGDFSLRRGSFDEDDLIQRIDLLKELKSVEEEMHDFDSELRSGDFISGETPSSLRSLIIDAEESLELLRKSGLRTTEELAEAQNDFRNRVYNSFWDDDSFEEAKKNIDDQEFYQNSLKNIREYIQNRQDLLEELQNGDIRNIFTDSDLDDFERSLTSDLKETNNQFKELQRLKGNGGNFDFTEVIEALNEIKKAIIEIKNAFEPLTTALKTEGTAFASAAKEGGASLDTLLAKLKSLGETIDEINKKDFSITQNIFEGKKSGGPSKIDLMQQEAKALWEQVKLLKQDADDIMNIFLRKGGYANEIYQLSETLAMLEDNDFDKRVTVSNNASLEKTIRLLKEAKAAFIKFNELFNTSGIKGAQWIPDYDLSDPDFKKTAVKVEDQAQASVQAKEEVVKAKGAIDELVGQIQEDLKAIRTFVQSIFDFDNLQFKPAALDSTLGYIYDKFVELQAKIKALDFGIEVTVADQQSKGATTARIDKAAESIKAEGEAAEKAAQQKKEFIDANKAAAQSAKQTAVNAKTAADSIETEGKAAADVAAKFTFDKLVGSDDKEIRAFAEQVANNRNLKVKSAIGRYVAQYEDGIQVGNELTGASITFYDPKTLQEIKEFYSIRAKLDENGQAIEGEYELIRDSFSVLEQTAKLEKQMADEEERRKKAIIESNKWLIQQEGYLNNQENKYKSENGAQKPLDGNTLLLNPDVSLLDGLSEEEKTIDRLAAIIRERIKSAMDGVVTAEMRNEIVQAMNALRNEIQVQQARNYQSTTMRAKDLETSRDIFRSYINALESDAKNANVFDQMSKTIKQLKGDVESFTPETFNAFVESYSKAQAEFTAARAAYRQAETERERISREEAAAWKAYDEEKDAAAQKEREINLSYEAKAAQEAADAEKELAQARKDADDFFKEEDSKKQKELNVLYDQRQQIISELTSAMQHLSKATDEATKKAAQQAVNDAKNRLNSITSQILDYGDLADMNKLERQNNAAVARLRKSNQDNTIKSQTKSAQEAQRELNDLYKQQAESAANILRYRNQLQSGNLGEAETRRVYEKLQAEKESQQEIQRQIKSYGDLYDATAAQKTIEEKRQEVLSEIADAQAKAADKQAKTEEKQDNVQKQKELNNLYAQRKQIISEILDYTKKLNQAADQGTKDAAQKAIDNATSRLDFVTSQIYGYGSAVDRNILDQQNITLVDGLHRDALNTFIKQSSTQTYEDVLKIMEKIYDIKKKLVSIDENSSDGQKLSRQLAALEEEYTTSSKLLSVEEQRNLLQNRYKLEKELSTVKQEQNELEAKKQEAERLKNLLALYNQYADAREKVARIDNDTSGKVSDQSRAKAIEDMANAQKKLLDTYGIDVTSQETLLDTLSKNNILTQEEMNKLLDEDINRREKINDLIREASDAETTRANKEQQKINKQNQNYGKTRFNQEQRNYDKVMANVRSLGDRENFSAELNAKINAYEDAYQRLSDLRKQFAENPEAAKDSALTKQFQDTALEAEKARKAIMDVVKEVNNLDNIPEEDIIQRKGLDENSVSSAREAMKAFASEISDGTFKFQGFNKSGNEMYGTMKTASGAIEKITIALNEANGEMIAFRSNSRDVGTVWEQVKSSVSKGITRLAGIYLSFQDIVRYARQGYEAVKEIDLAMTELKKVTDETDATYKKFLGTASQLSKTIGATLQDFTTVTSDFARLGYSLEESTNLAKAALIYENVGDGFSSVSEASESIISTMKAFKIEANDTMGIVDKFNEVGKYIAQVV